MLSQENGQNLVAWFRQKARSYPWSGTRDPYAIWISEVMLQQTVVTAVVDHYQRWIARWPDLTTLAAAGDDEVLRSWEGLGYYSRAKNLLKAARLLIARGQVTLPNDRDALQALPGFGAYTSAAVLSFAFDQPVLAVDANLKRIFQRMDAREGWSADLESRVRASADRYLFPGLGSRVLNAALMQLGQQVCTPRSPDCPRCPLAPDCRAYQGGLQGQIPRPQKRQVVELKTQVGIFLRNQNQEVFLAHPEKGRFSNLWLFPPAGGEGIRLTPRVHTYTRYKDFLDPRVFLAQAPVLPGGWTGRWVTWAEAENLGMPSVYRLILEETTTLVDR